MFDAFCVFFLGTLLGPLGSPLHWCCTQTPETLRVIFFLSSTWVPQKNASWSQNPSKTTFQNQCDFTRHFSSFFIGFSIVFGPVGYTGGLQKKKENKKKKEGSWVQQDPTHDGAFPDLVCRVTQLLSTPQPVVEERLPGLLATGRPTGPINLYAKQLTLWTG